MNKAMNSSKAKQKRYWLNVTRPDGSETDYGYACREGLRYATEIAARNAAMRIAGDSGNPVYIVKDGTVVARAINPHQKYGEAIVEGI
jgi:hypothetical protein